MGERNYTYTAIILTVWFLVFVINLGTMTVDIMEARNFVTVREMLESGDWLHPTMNGVLRLEKPPLPTWITAVFAGIFGLKSLFFLRLPAILMALWLLFSLDALVRRLTQDRLLAMLSAIVLSCMLYVILLGRRGTWDIYTHSFMMAAIVQFVAMFQSVKPLRRACWGGVLWGAAFLSKGPVAAYVLFLPFLPIYFLYYRPLLSREKYLSLLTYFLIAALVSSSWFGFVHIMMGDEALAIIEKEVSNWQSYNVRPWYYYLKDYPVHAGLWAAFLIMGIFTKYTWKKSRDKKTFQFFWLWTVLSVVLLSMVPEKKVRYLLPTFLPAAFLVATYFRYLLSDFDRKANRFDRIVFRLHWISLFLVCVAFPVVVYLFFYAKKQIGLGIMLAVCLTAFLCAVFFLFALRRHRRYFLLIGAVGLLSAAVIFVIPHTNTMANSDFHSIEEIQEKEHLTALPCYTLEDTRIELVWLISRKIHKVDCLDGLNLPCVLLTDKEPRHYLTTEDYQFIGYYDNNSKAQGHKHYEKGLSKYVTVIYHR